MDKNEKHLRELFQYDVNTRRVPYKLISKIKDTAKHITTLEQSNAELVDKLSTAYIDGYEKGHNDTVESCYGYQEEKANDWIIEHTIDGEIV